MLNDYKGEKPNNVITEEEHKKRPFFKRVSFWVLSALGLFFGGCSVYGLVLGYQYVQAVTQAAHIIADAQDSKDESFSKRRSFAYNVSDNYTHCVDLGSLSWNRTTASSVSYYYFFGDMPSQFPIVSRSGYVLDVFTNGGWGYIEQLTSDGMFLIQPNSNRLIVREDSFTSGSQLKSALNGKYIYYLTSAQSNIYSDVFGAGSAEGYQGGYDDGHQNGYQEGYADGSDAINLPQSVKVLLPVGNEYSVQYKSYVDGVVDRQGQLNSSQSGGAYATFDRSRTQKLRIDLTLPSGSRAFFLYTPSWTSAYPTDENYSLRQSWAVSGVTYLPTWVSKPQIYVGVTSADVPDLTYETVSVAFDVDHWGDIKVGAYSQGYNDGYQAGEENPSAYDSGYDAGYEQGYDDGHTIGVAQGESQAVSGQKALVNMFVTAFQQPFDQVYRFLNFNVLGLNILALFTALLTLSIGIIIIKKVI